MWSEVSGRPLRLLGEDRSALGRDWLLNRWNQLLRNRLRERCVDWLRGPREVAAEADPAGRDRGLEVLLSGADHHVVESQGVVAARRGWHPGWDVRAVLAVRVADSLAAVAPLAPQIAVLGIGKRPTVFFADALH